MSPHGRPKSESRSAKHEGTPARAGNVDTLAPLTPLQHGMLHHSRQDPASGVYIEQFSCVLHGPLDAARFRQAWAAVVQRHDVLKTLFIRLQEPQPVQVVRRQVTLPFVQDDWQGLAEAAQRERFDALLREDRARGFDPAQAPLMRVQLIATAPGRHRFLWTYHHAILDGWSMPILLGEVFQLYAAPDARLPAPRSDYRHYLGWLRAQDPAAALDFWRGHLKGYRRPLAFAPSMAPSPETRPPGPRRLAAHHGEMPPAWMDAAQRLCRTRRITLNTLCQGAFALLLAGLADTDDLVHGLVVSGRSAEVPGLDRMVGLFINTLPIRVRLDADRPLMDWLRALQADSQQVERLAHSALPEVLGCAEVPRTRPLFETLYVFENYPGQSAFRQMVAAQGLQVDELRAAEETSYPLALIVLPAHGLQFQFTYDTARFTSAAAARLAEQYAGLLQRLLEAADTPLRDIGLQPTPARAPSGPGAPVPAADPAGAALHVGEAAPDLARWHQLRRRALAFWAARDGQPGERVLLHAQEPAAGLALLLAGLERGLDVVVADPALPLADVLAAGPAAFGPALPRRVVVTGPQAEPMAGWPVDHFAADDPGDATAPAPQAPVPGKCSLLTRDPESDWVLVTHDAPQAAAGACLAAPPGGRIALIGSPLDPHHLAFACAALQAGCRVHAVAELAQLPAPAEPWHLVRFTPAQTRALAALPTGRAVPTLAWHVAAASLTPAGRAALHRLNPAAPIVHELCTPGALSHGRWPDGTGSPPATARVLDRRLRPAAIDAQGQLAIAGDTVPAALWRNGQPDLAARPQTREGPLLATGLRAWVPGNGPDDGHCAIETPQAASALLWPSPQLQALEARLRPHHDALALAECIDAQGEWQATVFIEPGAGFDIAQVPVELPAHIATVPVERLPRRPNGQVDRAALLRGDFTPARSGGHAAPRDALEHKLHAIWCDVLKRGSIGIHDDYFELGGQSLLAAVLLYQVQEQLGLAVEMDVLLRSPTIAGMAQALREGRTGAAEVPLQALQRDAVLPEDIRPLQPHQPGPAREVFLTGATGFLGVHLLADLLEHTEARVHCLVRAADAEAGLTRLTQALQAHGLWQPRHAERIVAVAGELGQPRFGLAEAGFDALAARIDAIYHSGALVNFVYPYAALKAANVDAVDEVLRLAVRHRTKPVHHVSTIGVLDRLLDRLPETLHVEAHGRLMGGYEQSKWVAEQRLALAAGRGVPVAIYRPSRIIGHSRTGRINPDDLFSRLIRGVVQFGKAPAGTGHDNMLPVDLAARMIVEASQHPDVAGHAVHVVNPRFTPFDEVLDFIEAEGHALERLPYGQWLDELAVHVQRVPTHPLAMLMPVLRKLDPEADPSLARAMGLEYGELQRFAPEALGALEVQGPEGWLRVVFDQFYATGYLQSARDCRIDLISGGLRLGAVVQI